MFFSVEKHITYNVCCEHFTPHHLLKCMSDMIFALTFLITSSILNCHNKKRLSNNGELATLVTVVSSLP